MRCPLLNGKYTKQCGAVKAVVVLSIGQLELYCESGHYEECPVYLTWKILSGQVISLAAYSELEKETEL
jgi:hypothetical protein